MFSVRTSTTNSGLEKLNFPDFEEVLTIEGAWDVSFNSKFGGPDHIQFDSLSDWTSHELRGIKYYSGIAKYTKSFEINNIKEAQHFIDLGVVKDMARVKMNGKTIGVIWCDPWRIDITEALKPGTNELEIEVANRWINRLLGDRQGPDTDVRTVKFENGLMGGMEYKTGRYTFTTKQSMSAFNYREPLPSGLLGPVRIISSKR
jgi:hypothetical protein